MIFESLLIYAHHCINPWEPVSACLRLPEALRLKKYSDAQQQKKEFRGINKQRTTASKIGSGVGHNPPEKKESLSRKYRPVNPDLPRVGVGEAQQA